MKEPTPKIDKAVALKYNKEKNGAPTVVAKGKGEVANNIIKLAQEHDIFIKKDADLVELLSKIEINKEIPPMLYKAVAEVFSFIYKITNDKRK
ncbi:MAG: EscU/YscU/HrcU family type III secretion system export apparatus switch protein [Sulfurospirillaceae bacterium]|jgi:flagellar biosynthesis protein|nr:EscU/YscU/HrcU family type III secretion system export apparatus switch protein [Sulfurospirillaceae bacterium]MDD2825372.1 EscU/YscU/HrcU family type III secretion system export apparatus switch protein [Sulfurospirillaceae bacterium]